MNIQENIYGMTALQPLLAGYPYLPFNNTSLKPIALNMLLNDIIINERKNILELGSGISTIMMARLAAKNNLNFHITSIDSSNAWLSKISNMLSMEKMMVASKITLIHAPLNHINGWYDMEILQNRLKPGYDLVFVDGPPAWNEKIRYARKHAFPFLTEYLDKKSYTIMLDDVKRIGETQAMNDWSSALNIGYKTYYDQLGVIKYNSPYDVSPI